MKVYRNETYSTKQCKIEHSQSRNWMKRIEKNANVTRKRVEMYLLSWWIIKKSHAKLYEIVKWERVNKTKVPCNATLRTLLKDIQQEHKNKTPILLSNSNSMGLHSPHKHIQHKSAALSHTCEKCNLDYGFLTCKSSCYTQIDFGEQQSKLLGAEFMWVNVRNR